MSATPSTNGELKLFSCKISLKYSRPPVWRRVRVPVDYTFKDLHEVIIAVMEWDNTHLHMFRMKQQLLRQPIEIHGPGVQIDDDDYDGTCYLPESTMIAPYMIRLKQKIQYEYDFGCSFEHVIEFEKTVDADSDVTYPKCTVGKGMPPPENDPDGIRSEVFDLNRMNMNLGRCRQISKKSGSEEVKSVSEKCTSSPANDVLEGPNEPPSKKRVIGTDQLSSSTVPVVADLQKDNAVDSNSEKNSSSASADDSIEVKP